MKIFAITVFLAAITIGVGGANASSLHRKRSIENKYVTTNNNVIEEEKNEEYVDPYLGYRKLEESMSMDNDESSSASSTTEKIPPPAYTTELFHNFESGTNKNTKYTNFVSALDHLFFFHNNDLYTLNVDGEVTPITGGGGEDTSASIWTNFGESDSSYAVLNDMLYMFVGDDENNVQLFKTDGTNQGTMKVKDINVLEERDPFTFSLSEMMNGNSNQIIAYKDKLYFYELDQNEDDETVPTLYVSDGTEEGTEAVETGVNSDLPTTTMISYIIEYDGKTYFPAGGQVCKKGEDVTIDVNGTEVEIKGNVTCETDTALFVLEDGKEAVQFADFNSSIDIGQQHDTKMTVNNGLLYFQTTEGGLYRTDGTQEGTFALNINGAYFTPRTDEKLIFFCAEVGDSRLKSICETDGTINGTMVIAASGSEVGSSKGLTPFGDKKILFHNRRKRQGVITPTTYDPSKEKVKQQVYTLEVKGKADLDTSDVDSYYVIYEDVAFFKAADQEGNETLGSELYATNGISKGTALVSDINRGKDGSDIRGLGLLGDSLYVMAYTDDSGYDIYRVEPCPEEGCATYPPTPAPILLEEETEEEIPDGMPWEDGNTKSSASFALVSNFYVIVVMFVSVVFCG